MVALVEIWLSRNRAAAMMSLVNPAVAAPTLESQLRLMTRPDPAVVTRVAASADHDVDDVPDELPEPPRLRLAMVPRSPTAAVSESGLVVLVGSEPIAGIAGIVSSQLFQSKALSDRLNKPFFN